MTRLAIDAEVALRLIIEGRPIGEGHTLVGAASLRSLVSAELYRRVRAGELETRAGRELLERVAELRIRLLGDRGSRAMAWKLASELGRDEIGPIETLAVAVLQADALVTDDPGLVAAAEGRVPLAGYDALFG
ncbi:hypothetical protein [Microbacterium sp. KR10-403]|uniref:hypothetical protein n=1 Tax=Microbacterium sp. KR10-403 TaxID=3158581 RepID=UPI0032E369B4